MTADIPALILCQQILVIIKMILHCTHVHTSTIVNSQRVETT